LDNKAIESNEPSFCIQGAAFLDWLTVSLPRTLLQNRQLWIRRNIL